VLATGRAISGASCAGADADSWTDELSAADRRFRALVELAARVHAYGQSVHVADSVVFDPVVPTVYSSECRPTRIARDLKPTPARAGTVARGMTPIQIFNSSTEKRLSASVRRGGWTSLYTTNYW
jgi:hypothetical protein